jgi:serine/threonine protein kinase
MVKMSLNNYDRKELLGEGTFGKVYKAVHKSSNLTVALKCISNENILDKYGEISLKNEI